MIDRRTLFLLALALVVIFAGVPFIPGAAGWEGWSVMSALGTAAAGGALLLVAWQILLEQKGHSLEQVRFAMDLSPRLHEHGRAYEEAWRTLHDYSEVPETMTGSAWREAVAALQKAYASVHFLWQIERLRQREIVSTDLLTLMYFDSLVEHVDGKVGLITKWLNTGLDLAAGYSAHDVEMLTPALRNLVEAVSKEHEHHGGVRYEHIFEGFVRLQSEIAKARAVEDELRLGSHVKVDWDA